MITHLLLGTMFGLVIGLLPAAGATTGRHDDAGLGNRRNPPRPRPRSGIARRPSQAGGRRHRPGQPERAAARRQRLPLHHEGVGPAIGAEPRAPLLPLPVRPHRRVIPSPY